MKPVHKEGIRAMRHRAAYQVLFYFVSVVALVSGAMTSAFAVDTEITRSTLSGLKGVYVVVENFNPNVLKYEKYLKNVALSKENIAKEAEYKLKQAGIATFNMDEWVKAPGRPVLYISCNTHESEKYLFAYDVKLSFQQLIFLERNPKIKTLGETWSINITGLANIGNLNVIKNDTLFLLGKFINAYKMVNGVKDGK